MMSPGDFKILVCCEHTGALSSEFAKLGFDVTTCDLKPSYGNCNHYQGDVFDIVPGSFNALIGFPPCTYLANSGIHFNKTVKGRSEKTLSAALFVEKLFSLDIQFIALENPVGWLNINWRMPTQIIRPWYFGDPYRKEICLWLKGLPPLIDTCVSPIRKHVANHTNGRMSQDIKSEIKSSWLWYPNMCKAIASQWSNVLLSDCVSQTSSASAPLVYPLFAEVSKQSH